MIKAPFSSFSMLATFLLVSYTACNAQDPQTGSNQFMVTGSVSKSFIYTVTAGSPLLGHFVMIPDARISGPRSYVGESLAVDIDTSTLINGTHADLMKLDDILLAGKKVLSVNFKDAPESLPSTSVAKFNGTATSLTLTETPQQLSLYGEISQGFVSKVTGNTLGNFVMIPHEELSGPGSYAEKTIVVTIDTNTLINGIHPDLMNLDKILVPNKKALVQFKKAPEEINSAADATFAITAVSLTLQ